MSSCREEQSSGSKTKKKHLIIFILFVFFKKYLFALIFFPFQSITTLAQNFSEILCLGGGGSIKIYYSPKKVYSLSFSLSSSSSATFRRRRSINLCFFYFYRSTKEGINPHAQSRLLHVGIKKTIEAAVSFFSINERLLTHLLLYSIMWCDDSSSSSYIFRALATSLNVVRQSQRFKILH